MHQRGAELRWRQPITLSEWLDRLASKAWAVVAAGTCATYGGIHAMENNPTGAMRVADYLGWNFRSKAGLPIVNVPECPVQPDNMSETLLYLLHQADGVAPMIPLDEKLRPVWLFGQTAHAAANAPATTRSAISPGSTAVERDYENRVYVAVALDGDPAGDLNGAYNRYFYFDPDELELIEGKES